MSSSITIVVPTVPVAQPRQRHRVIQSGGRQFAHNYTPSKHPVQQFKSDLRLAWLKEANHHYGDKPITAAILIVFPRPASKTRKRGDNPRLLHTSKPDAENVAKAVLDALTGLAWNDDKQVCDLLIRKRIAAANESAHVVLTIAIAELETPTT
jgi:Holliday junction resolvase RusA-like endonuclease